MERRRFLRQVLGDGVSLIEELRGRPQLRLRDLPHVPAAALLRVVPVYLDGVTVFGEGGRMWGQRQALPPVDLYDDAGPETFVLSRFDGQSSVADVADELVIARQWDRERARALACDVFLRLAGAGLCAPAGPLTGVEEDPQGEQELN